VLFHLACDTARTAGRLVGATRLARTQRRESPEPAGTVKRQAAGGNPGDEHDPTIRE
jgi:hypothetical protein